MWSGQEARNQPHDGSQPVKPRSAGEVDVLELIDWAVACGLDPVEAFKGFLKRR